MGLLFQFDRIDLPSISLAPIYKCLLGDSFFDQSYETTSRFIIRSSLILALMCALVEEGTKKKGSVWEGDKRHFRSDPKAQIFRRFRLLIGSPPAAEFLQDLLLHSAKKIRTVRN